MLNYLKQNISTLFAEAMIFWSAKISVSLKLFLIAFEAVDLACIGNCCW